MMIICPLKEVSFEAVLQTYSRKQSESHITTALMNVNVSPFDMDLNRDTSY